MAGLILGTLGYTRGIYVASINNLEFGLQNVPFVSNQEVEQYTKMLLPIPEGETILTRLEKPFLLDFRQNKIFITDLPGGASLPPGMPFFKGSEPLANYLTSKSIRYVAYSYASEAGYSRKNFADRLKPEENTCRANASKINKTKWTNKLVCALNAK